MSVTNIPEHGGKRRHLARDLCLLGIFAAVLAVPISPFVSSLIYRDQPRIWFEFPKDQDLSEAVRLDSIHVAPLTPGNVSVTVNYSQLLAGEKHAKTVLCFHVVPEDRDNLEPRYRESGFNQFDLQPDPPLGTWQAPYSRQKLLKFPRPSNQRATIRLATWDPVAKQASAMHSYSFDFAEFDRGTDGNYAEHIASPHRRDLAFYLATTATLLVLLMAFSRLKKPR